jgi:hypothetical protein
MARKPVRVAELEEAILEACETIDNTDQSRTALSEGLDNVREILAEAYGDDFDDDLAERTGEGDEDEDDSGSDDEDDD